MEIMKAAIHRCNAYTPKKKRLLHGRSNVKESKISAGGRRGGKGRQQDKARDKARKQEGREEGKRKGEKLRWMDLPEYRKS